MLSQQRSLAAGTHAIALCGGRRWFTWGAVRVRGISICRLYLLPALALIMLLAACTPFPLPAPNATATPTPTLPTTFRPTRTAIPYPPPPTSTVPMDDLLAMVESRLPRAEGWGNLPQAQAVPLAVPPGKPHLWVVYAHILGTDRQIVAVYTHEDGRWRELAWREFSFDEMPIPRFFPDVTTVQITADRAWFVVDGFSGMHGSTWTLFSFDSRQLILQISLVNDAYNLGQIRDINGDGVPDVVADESDYYILCGGCDVGQISLQAWAWDPAIERMVRKYLNVAPPATAQEPAAKLNNEAVRLAYAGLWKDADRLIGQARASLAAGQPALADTVRWNEAIIRAHTDAMLAAIAGTRRGGASPELNYLFYGDYAADIDTLRQVPLDALFPAPGSRSAEPVFLLYTKEARAAIHAALTVQPELAPAHFLEGWLAYQRHDAATARTEVGRAAALAPTDVFYQAALVRLNAPDAESAASTPTP